MRMRRPFLSMRFEQPRRACALAHRKFFRHQGRCARWLRHAKADFKNRRTSHKPP
jgi:hypothetical protein